MKALKDYRKKIKQLQTEFLALRNAEVKVLSRQLLVFHADILFSMSTVSKGRLETPPHPADWGLKLAF